MLRSLSIRDFVLVDRLELEFAPGFSVLTGETGAGKSILIDALAAVLGERADASQVRGGCERADITAEFLIGEDAELQALLSADELLGDPGVILLRRVIEAGGRSRAWVNGQASTAQQVRSIAERLVDIHGQHAHQSLLRAEGQRELLDAFAGAREVAREVARLHGVWAELSARRREWESGAEALAAEREQLEWRVKELAALEFTPEDWENLNAEHRRLSHAASLIESSQFGLDALSEDDAAVLAVLSSVISRLSGELEHDVALKEVLDALEPARIQVQEAVYSLRHYQQRMDVDPARLRGIENRIDLVQSAARKFRVNIADIPEQLARARSRLDQLQTGMDLDQITKKEQEAEEAYRKLAGKLTAVRTAAAEKLSGSVTASMQLLAMTGGVFGVALLPLQKAASHGLEQVEFQASANTGIVPRPLAKVASGGELSRMSLAIQSALSQVAQVPTLIFDEVDAGIGGRVAEIVGGMLQGLGGRHQVMCITHLPQVAAAAHSQFRVAKESTGGAVRSRVSVLTREQRIDELARMLGGVKITDTTRKHAEEMLLTATRKS
jgi:DNA repair protein RecN (Recombination protein N)